jgi:hypothetical protein
VVEVAFEEAEAVSTHLSHSEAEEVVPLYHMQVEVDRLPALPTVAMTATSAMQSIATDHRPALSVPAHHQDLVAHSPARLHRNPTVKAATRRLRPTHVPSVSVQAASRFQTRVLVPVHPPDHVPLVQTVLIPRLRTYRNLSKAARRLSRLSTLRSSRSFKRKRRSCVRKLKRGRRRSGRV